MVNITWLPPAIQNGVITYYTLIITEEQFNIGELIINSTTTNYMLTGLEEFNDYSCRVAAATRAGVGPFSEFILFTTLEDGMMHTVTLGLFHHIPLRKIASAILYLIKA